MKLCYTRLVDDHFERDGAEKILTCCHLSRALLMEEILLPLDHIITFRMKIALLMQMGHLSQFQVFIPVILERYLYLYLISSVDGAHFFAGFDAHDFGCGEQSRDTNVGALRKNIDSELMIGYEML